MKPRFLTTNMPLFSDLEKSVKATNHCCFCYSSGMELPFIQSLAPPASWKPILAAGPVIFFWKYLSLHSLYIILFPHLSEGGRKA